MFGTEPVSPGAAPDFPEALGAFLENPVAALRRLKLRPDLSQAAVVVLLAGLAGPFAAFSVRPPADPADLGRSLLGALWSAAAGWLVPALLWHGASRLFKRPGRLRALIGLLGWSAAVFWLLLPLSLLGSFPGAAGRLAHLGVFAVKAGYLYLAWWCLKINYGWKNLGAALVLFFPPLLAAALLAAAGAFLGAAFVGGALFSKFFL